METKKVPITPKTVTERGKQLGMEPGWVQFPEGPAWCVEALSCTITTIEFPDTGERRILMTVVAPRDNRAFGAMMPLSAEQARSLGASIMAAAQELEAPVSQ